MRHLACFVVLAWWCLAQSPPPSSTTQPDPSKLSEIRVTVVDALTRDPVTNTSVALVTVDPEKAGRFPRLAIRRPDNTFSMPRDYAGQLTVQAPGYTQTAKKFTATEDKHTFTITLARPGKMHGVLVDTDSGLPLEKIKVASRQVRYHHGKLDALRPANETTTDKEGRFTLQPLESGDYVIETTESVVSTGVEDQPDIGYPRRDWPGGGSIENASPIRLLAGHDENLGKIPISKGSLYQITIKPVGPNCSEDKYYRIEIFRDARLAPSALDGKVAHCGESVTLTGLGPGSWDARVLSSNPEAVGLASVGLVRSNVTATLDLRLPADVSGRVILDRWENSSDANSLLPAGLQVQLFPRSLDDNHQTSPFPVRPPSAVQTDGTYEGEVFIPTTGRISVIPFGLPKGYVLTGVRANGRRTSSSDLTVDPYAATLDLDVLLTPAAILEGTIQDCACIARVFAIPQPVVVQDAYPVGVTELIASSGHFTFDRLTPGKYSIVAVPETGIDDNRLEEPGRLLSLAISAKTIEATAGRTATVEVPLSVY